MNKVNSQTEDTKPEQAADGGNAKSPCLQPGQHQNAETDKAQSHHHSSEDEADRWMRFLAEWTKKKFKRATLIDVVQAIVGVYVAFVGTQALRIYGGQLQEMKKTTTITNDSLILGNRPWIGVDGLLTIVKMVDVQHPLLNANQPPQVEINSAANFAIKNFGRDPALHVSVNAEIVTTQHWSHIQESLTDLAESAKGTCVMADLGALPISPGSEGSGPVVFPGNPLPIFNLSLSTTAPEQTTNASLTIVGCISYRDQFHSIHHTSFCFTSYSPMSTVVPGRQLQPCIMNEGAT